MRIGVVLARVPGYSETFFHSKISGLVESGHSVFIFVNSNDNQKVLGAQVVSAPVVSKKFILLQIFLIIYSLVKLSLFAPVNTYRFIKYELKDNERVFKIVQKLYLNSHILTYPLDWLHFGFSTMTLGKENVAIAIGAKMAVSFRGYDINIYPLKNPGCYDKLWAKVDKVHSISDDLYQKAVRLGLPETIPYVKITPAIDVGFFRGKEKTLSFKGKIVIVTIARLSWIKGLEYSIEAMSRLKHNNIDFEYHIIGDGVEYERLKFAIFQFDLEGNVFLDGIKNRTEINDYLNRCDVYLQPSLEEGFCNAVLEAQASSCLCIVSDVGGLRENIKDKVTGWLVPKRDSRAISNKILDVIALTEAEKRVIMRRAENRVIETFSLDKQIEKFLNFYSI